MRSAAKVGSRVDFFGGAARLQEAGDKVRRSKRRERLRRHAQPAAEKADTPKTGGGEGEYAARGCEEDNWPALDDEGDDDDNIFFPVCRIFQEQSSNGRGLLDLWRAKRDATSPGAAKGSSTFGEARLVLSCCLVDTKPVLRSVELLFRSPTPSRYQGRGRQPVEAQQPLSSH